MRVRVGVSGSGFIARGLIRQLSKRPHLRVSRVLSRKNRFRYKSFPFPNLLTTEIDELTSTSDIIIECSGHVARAYDVIKAAVDNGIPVITMNAEFQVTLGSIFSDMGWINEAQGDQPGSLALLAEDVRNMGFKPVVYGSQKGFLDPNPSRESMKYWARKQGLRLQSVTAFTDGTKVEIEQALIANTLGAGIAAGGMLGPKAETLEIGGFRLASYAERMGEAISDYVLLPGGTGEVFIVASHEDDQTDALRYYKLGDGPYYIIKRPFHLGHLEIGSAIQRCISGLPPLLAPVAVPRYSVAAVAKQKLHAGEKIQKGVGSFAVRGKTVSIADFPNHLPIGLLENCVLKKPVEDGQIVTIDDVSLENAGALDVWNCILGRATQYRQRAAYQ